MTKLEAMGKRLRDVMDTHGLTQEAFAKKFGFTQGYFSQILMGKHEPAMPYQQKAAGGVGVVEELQARVAALEKKLAEMKKK